VTLDSTHPSTWSMGKDPHNTAGEGTRIVAAVRAGCVRKYLQGRGLRAMHDCHKKLPINRGGDTASDRS